MRVLRLSGLVLQGPRLPSVFSTGPRELCDDVFGGWAEEYSGPGRSRFRLWLRKENGLYNSITVLQETAEW